ncbi:MAG: hypothetical protein H6912_05435 [Kordiimonadaceae bacterium]|nr:hypothetical protein [Kordiimonadaceae bacterium]
MLKKPNFIISFLHILLVFPFFLLVLSLFGLYGVPLVFIYWMGGGWYLGSRKCERCNSTASYNPKGYSRYVPMWCRVCGKSFISDRFDKKFDFKHTQNSTDNTFNVWFYIKLFGEAIVTFSGVLILLSLIYDIINVMDDGEYFIPTIVIWIIFTGTLVSILLYWRPTNQIYKTLVNVVAKLVFISHGIVGILLIIDKQYLIGTFLFIISLSVLAIYDFTVLDRK